MAVLLFVGPRGAILVWWLLTPGRFDRAFDSFIVPVLGILFAPVTTLMYLGVFPRGINTLDTFLLAAAVLVDIVIFVSGGYRNRGRVPGLRSTS